MPIKLPAAPIARLAAFGAVLALAPVLMTMGSRAQSLASLSSAPLAMAPLPPAALARPAFAPQVLAPIAPPFRPAASARPGGASLGLASPGRQCRQAIRAAERAAGIPEQLMAAIARIESGRREADGSVNPWPWSINVEGTDHVFDSKREAVAAVQALQARGIRSIDVGCMQVNLLHHPDAFVSLDDAFDPTANAVYAARFLVQLHEQTGAWPTATAWYHSATPELGDDYRRKVMAVWPDEMRQGKDTTQSELATAWAATRPAGVSGLTARLAAGGIAGNRVAAARLLPQAAGVAGHTLATYRAVPIPLAVRPLPPVAATAPSSHG